MSSSLKPDTTTSDKARQLLSDLRLRIFQFKPVKITTYASALNALPMSRPMKQFYKQRANQVESLYHFDCAVCSTPGCPEDIVIHLSLPQLGSEAQAYFAVKLKD